MEKLLFKLKEEGVKLPLILSHVTIFQAYGYVAFAKSTKNEIFFSVENFYKPISKR